MNVSLLREAPYSGGMSKVLYKHEYNNLYRGSRMGCLCDF